MAVSLSDSFFMYIFGTVGERKGDVSERKRVVRLKLDLLHGDGDAAVVFADRGNRATFGDDAAGGQLAAELRFERDGAFERAELIAGFVLDVGDHDGRRRVL